MFPAGSGWDLSRLQRVFPYVWLLPLCIGEPSVLGTLARAVAWPLDRYLPPFEGRTLAWMLCPRLACSSSMCGDSVRFGTPSVPGDLAGGGVAAASFRCCQQPRPPPVQVSCWRQSKPGAAPPSCSASLSPCGAFGQIKFGKNPSWSC